MRQCILFVALELNLNKPDFPPLLPPGIHRMSLDDIRAVCVDPFPADRQRSRLYVNLIQWIDGLRAAQVTAILWIDGSFVTAKPAPADIDCLMWNPDFLGSVSTSQKSSVLTLTNRRLAKAKHKIDLYIEMPSDEIEKLHRQAYWKGMFGFQHDGISAKGFVEFQL